jgi:uncharacterized protein
MFLLDANVLIALIDAQHPHGDTAIRFFVETAVPAGWATCPLTENAFLRILGNPSYPGGPGSTTAARELLSKLTAAPGHQLWPDDHSLLDPRRFPRLPATRHLTDVYLLALAVSRQARLATFDHALDPTLVPGGPAAYHVLDHGKTAAA